MAGRESLRADNGPEFCSRRMLGWAEERKIALVHIQPGRPMQNRPRRKLPRYRLRDECLNAHWFRHPERCADDTGKLAAGV